MTRSQLQAVVIQYIAIITFNMILFHEVGRNAYDQIWEDPVVKNFTTTWNKMPINATASKNTSGLYNGTSSDTNLTLLNGTFGSLFEEPKEAFYFSFLPRNIFVHALLCPLAYYWQIWLERAFPARPRPAEKDEKIEFNVNEGQEEEVVKRWIAQGKIKRASVSWWNTFVKWVLDITVGTLWFLSLRYLVDGFVRWDSLAEIRGGFIPSILLGFFSSFLSIAPFTSLIGFIIVPATKRVVFAAAVDTIEAVFLDSFFRLTLPWAVGTEFVQNFLANTTEDLMKHDARRRVNGTRLIDEL